MGFSGLTMYVYGDTRYDIKSLESTYENEQNLRIKKIPFSNLFSIVKSIYKTTLIELADSIASFTPAEYRKKIIDEFGDDKIQYRKKYAQYRLALECRDLVEQIKKDMK